MKAIIYKACVIVVLLLSFQQNGFSQCTSFNVNLTGDPDSVWRSSLISRNGQCCGAPSSQTCISFSITLDPNTAGVWFYMTGAPALGSEYYQEACGTPHSMRDTICLSGVGPHQITFCKPGNNPNQYIIEAIAKPTFPPNDSIRIGCSKVLETHGIKPGTITWTSIYPGVQGAYNSYLSCTTCPAPVITPGSNPPAYIDYLVCGDPIATMCGYNLRVCDTVRVNIYQPLTGSITPNPATFCNTGPGAGVMLTATGTGGVGAYSYKWRNSAGVLVGTGSNYFATSATPYTVEINDALTGDCPGYFVTIPVTAGSVPVVQAGVDQYVCPSSPTAYLNGSVQYATGGTWIGGNGTFLPGRGYLNASYTPTAAELAAGSVQLVLQSSGAGGGCINSTDTLKINYPSALNVSLTAGTLLCNSSTTTITSTVTGGMLPYSYGWNTGESTSSIIKGQGVYQLTIEDAIGCIATSSVNVTAPGTLSISTSSTNVTVNGGSNGTATATVTGGVAPFTYSWNSTPAQTTATATGLSYGVYTVQVLDANGCSMNGSVVVNEPRCLGFSASVTNDQLNCFGDNDGSITATIVGGTAPFSYSWNTIPAQTLQTASNLTSGSYLLLVTDNNGCVQAAYGTVTEPTQLVNNMTSSDASVIGGTDGSATSNPSGGTPGYSYSWSTLATTQSINSLSANTYYLTVKDTKNCQVNDTVTIAEPPCNNLIIGVSVNHVGCYGGATGNATVNIVHGNAPFSITWSTGASSPSISSLTAGNYWVKVKDNINCEKTVYFTITQPSPLSIALAPTSASCNGLTNGTIELSVSGGSYPYAYSWSNGTLAEDLHNLSPGTYSVNVSDINGCTKTGVAVITEPTKLTVSHTTTDISCYNGSNGSINLTVSGGVLPYNYNWSNGATTEDINGVTAGYFVVSVQDANGCNLSAPISILVDQPDSIKVDSVRVSCPSPGSPTTGVQFYTSGGTGALSYSFDNGITYQPSGQTFFNLPIDNIYTVTAKDANNCILPASYNLVLDSSVAVSQVNFATCTYPPSSTTPVTVVPAGGDGGPYTVSYDGGLTYNTAGTYTFTLNTGATYNFIVKDSKGCISETRQVLIPSAFSSSVVITSNYNGQNISCNGATDGAVNLTVSGGTSPYTYAWSNGATSEDLSSLAAGTYSVTVTDVNGCSTTASVTLTQPAALTSSAVITSSFNGQNISCNGAADGAVNLTVNGGTGVYTYAWSNGATTEDLSSIAAGTYSVTATDANGCSTTASVTLTQPAVLTSSAVITSNYNGQNISCNGATDGAADLTVTGGTAPYTYAWSNGATTEDLSALAAGTYSVTVTDVNGCSATASVTLTEPAALTSSAVVSSNYNGQNISCNGSTDGAADLTVTGGTAPYTYTWSNGATTQDIAALGAGTYAVTITDVNGCSATASVTLNEPAVLTSSAVITSNYNGQNISCNGATDGAADLTVTGGTAPYTYAWSNGVTSEDLSALAAGTYSVSVTDVNGCSTTASVTLTEPAVLTSSAVITSNYNGQNISCNGATDGAADLTVTGGTAPYTYAWSNGATTEDLSALAAGTYSVTVTDVNGCSATASVTLTEPAALTSSAIVSSNFNGQNISCNGATDGAADLTVTGGTAPSTYAWSNGATTEDLAGLGAGTYSVTITDVNGCSATASVTLTEPAVLTSSAVITSNYNGQNISCNGATDGAADLTVTGGTAPYTYVWSNGATTEDLSALAAGTYSVSVTDVNGCSTTASVTLTEPAVLTSSAVITSNFNGQNISCNGATDGAADLTVNGGTAPYTYAWSNGATTEDLSALAAGTYSVTVTDVNGCSATASVTLTEPAALTSSAVVSSNYNGQNISCNGATDGAADLTVTGGTAPYTYTWSNGATTQDIAALGAGTYAVTITDVNGCSATASVTLTEPAVLTSSAVITSNYNGQNISCNGATDGAADLTVTGGTAPYTYAWSNGATSEDLSNLAAGGYLVVIKDVNGCLITNNIQLTQPATLNITAAVTNVTCNGFSNGAINTTVTGGTAAYSYQWNTSATSDDLANITAGIYTLTVTDVNGCTGQYTAEVKEDQKLLIVSVVNDAKCNSSKDGNVNITVNGGVEPYTYTWSNGATTQDLFGVGSGNYIVTVKDSNNCTSTESVTIVQPDSLKVVLEPYTYANGFNVSLYDAEDGSIDAEITGGTSPYNTTWSTNATTEDLSNVAAGSYTVLVSDFNGCIVSATIKLTEPFVLEMPTGYSPNGDSRNDKFVVHGIESYPDNVLEVYNRWGNIVYSTNNYYNQWSGENNSGEQLPDATYFVVLNINNGQIILKGYVDLRR